MIVYIAGPMKGRPDLNHPAFMAAEAKLASLGYKVLNPAKLPQGMSPDWYMPRCLDMVNSCDVLAHLPGWEGSAGATIEVLFAEYQGKRIVEYEWLSGQDAEVWE